MNACRTDLKLKCNSLYEMQCIFIRITIQSYCYSYSCYCYWLVNGKLILISFCSQQTLTFTYHTIFIEHRRATSYEYFIPVLFYLTQINTHILFGRLAVSVTSYFHYAEFT